MWYITTMWPFTRKAAKPAPPPRLVDVQRIDAKITENDGTVYELVFDGEYMGCDLFDSSKDWIMTGWTFFRSWQLTCGETGMAGVGHGKYVPMCNIKSITTTRSVHMVPAVEKDRDD